MASGSLRPFGPVSGLNVARGSSVLYLTRGDNVTPLYVSWEQYSSGECRTHSWTRGSSVAFGSLRPFGPVSGSNVARSSSVLYLTSFTSASSGRLSSIFFYLSVRAVT